MAQTICGDAV